MTDILPPFRLTGGLSLRNGALAQRSLAVENGRITKGPLPEIDATGFYILPGIVDLHAEACARERAPLATLREAAAEAAAAGITTAWIAQDWSWEGGQRTPDRAASLLAALSDHAGAARIDLRLALRCQTHMVDEGPRLLDLVRRYGVDQVIFRDTLEQMIEMAAFSPDRFALKAAAAGRTPEAHLDVLRAARRRAGEVPRHLCRLAEAFDAAGVVYGSLDDPDAETRERYAMIGARAAVFPRNRRVAASAVAMGDPVILAAPDVAAARHASINLVRSETCTALASAWRSGALAEAAWALVDQGLADLPRAWGLISTAPAAIMRLPDRGALDFGLRADFVMIDRETRAIEATVSAGRLAYATPRLAARFARRPARHPLAAE